MKNTMWMVSVAIIAVIQFGCSKKNGLSPDDTALIKGTDRGTFVRWHKPLMTPAFELKEPTTKM